MLSPICRRGKKVHRPNILPYKAVKCSKPRGNFVRRTCFYSLEFHPQLYIRSFIMFQRTILRQAQAARSLFSTSSPSTASLALRRTTQQRLPALRPFAPQTTRFFSTEKEAENAETEAEDSDAKKLEAKEREIIDLKVQTVPVSSNLLARHLPHVNS